MNATFLADRVKAIRAADEAQLATLYKDLIGYNPFEEAVDSVEGVREILLDYVREECSEAGVHCSEVGL